MNNKKKLSFLIIPLPILVGGLSSLLSGSMSESMKKPPLTPPGWLFPIVWTVLYLLMGISAYLVLRSDDWKISDGIKYFFYQLTVNFVWPIIFFRFEMYGTAVVVLGILILLTIATISEFSKTNKLSAWLLVPYLAWLLFALYLNIGVAFLN